MSTDNIPAMPDQSAAEYTGSTRIKLPGYDCIGEINMMMKGGICKAAPISETYNFSTHRTYPKKSYKDDILTLQKSAPDNDSYYNIDIEPADELLLIEDYCRCLESEGYDASLLTEILNEAREKILLENPEEFHAAVESFYTEYESIVCGKGGILYPSGDYLSFSAESVRVRFYTPEF